VSLYFKGILWFYQFTEYSPNQESVEQRRGNCIFGNVRRRWSSEIVRFASVSDDRPKEPNIVINVFHEIDGLKYRTGYVQVV
jgi:hypothetical protein